VGWRVITDDSVLPVFPGRASFHNRLPAHASVSTIVEQPAAAVAGATSTVDSSAAAETVLINLCGKRVVPICFGFSHAGFLGPAHRASLSRLL
jgi:hypothetical protein